MPYAKFNLESDWT